MTYNERKELTDAYFGKTVTVKIDRPVGYIHKKKNRTLEYRINYGYIPGVTGGDGEELDVYVLGVNEPLEEFTGRVIGVIYRKNDVEDKLVAAPEGAVFYQNEIAEAVAFQEKYYNTRIKALYQKSCGVAVYRKNGGKTEYLLLFQRRSRTWSFPKGHMEPGETEEQTALRETVEETGMTVSCLPGFREEVDYNIAGVNRKTVVLFAAPVNGEPKVRESEIESYAWADAAVARKLLYPEYGRMLDAAEKIIQ